jgi:hypothetical protein
MTVERAAHGTIGEGGTATVEFATRKHVVTITNVDDTTPLWVGFDDGAGASAGDDNLDVVLPRLTREFIRIQVKVISLYSDSAVEYNVEGR